MPLNQVPLPTARRPALLAAGLGVTAIATLSVIADAGSAVPRAVDGAAVSIPYLSDEGRRSTRQPTKPLAIAPQDAASFGGSVSSPLLNRAAQPFSVATGKTADRGRAIACLTSAIYYEAATEPVEGQRAVAQVVLNRVRHAAYPNSVCGVVYQGMERKTGCQFTFTCDGSLARAPMVSYWSRARRIAEAALSGSVYEPVGLATHYHATWVDPYWSSSLVKAAVVGTHIFYRWAGRPGTSAGFRTRYAGAEPDVNKLRLAAGTTNPATAAETKNSVLSPKQTAALAAGESGHQTGLLNLPRAVLRRNGTDQSEKTANAVVTQPRGVDAFGGRKRWSLTRDAPEDDRAARVEKAEANEHRRQPGPARTPAGTGLSAGMK